ncbi:MAG: pantetheine-phosphate adenylyltransferase [Candidatus Omnitrophota bacterium]|nr:MAG: pantetheine-phosphate adenylyltransferase [Candidatus Omnitrophota bacterium]
MTKVCVKKRAVYPGTFDPVTYGHIDLIKRATRIFDQIIVAVAANLSKQPLFSIAERVSMLKKATSRIQGVTVESFDQLMIDYAASKKTNVIIRGLRMISDFEYEFQMALTNRRLNSKMEVVFMMPQESYSFLSSKLIKEIAYLNGDVSGFVPSFVAKKLKQVLSDRK